MLHHRRSTSTRLAGGALARFARAERSLIELLIEQRFDFFTGVPDPALRERISEARRFVPAVSEDIAVGLATGAWLGGSRAAVFVRNGGLTMAVHALTTVSSPYRIPLLLVVDDGEATPVHILPLLEAVRIPFFIPDAETLANDLADAAATMESDRCPVALLVRAGVQA